MFFPGVDVLTGRAAHVFPVARPARRVGATGSRFSVKLNPLAPFRGRRLTAGALAIRFALLPCGWPRAPESIAKRHKLCEAHGTSSAPGIVGDVTSVTKWNASWQNPESRPRREES